jgi:hypothetical protein
VIRTAAGCDTGVLDPQAVVRAAMHTIPASKPAVRGFDLVMRTAIVKFAARAVWNGVEIPATKPTGRCVVAASPPARGGNGSKGVLTVTLSITQSRRFALLIATALMAARPHAGDAGHQHERGV